ncbi:hypothetical protein JL721_10732 [Aureococcus anophagefferens]|nr:hypothetical protein JL721_10732 [Aureococcus anophagefferens]
MLANHEAVTLDDFAYDNFGSGGVHHDEELGDTGLYVLSLEPRATDTTRPSRRGEAGPLVRGDDGYYERRAVELACDLNGAFTRLCMEGVYDATRKRVLTFCGPTVVDLKAVRNHEGVSFKTNPDVFSAARAPWSAMSDPTVAQVDHAPLEDAGALGLVAEATLSEQPYKARALAFLELDFGLLFADPVTSSAFQHLAAQLKVLLAVYSDPKPTDTFGLACDELLPTVREASTAAARIFDLLWPPLHQSKSGRMFAWRTPSAHTFFVHFLSTFEKNECHLGRYNEEVFENAHILNKKLLHVAVFPAPTHVLQ